MGFLTIGNIRSGSRVIESSFIERLVTDPKPLLQSSKRGGDGFERQSFVVGSSANQGRFSTDLMNRSLPVRLELIGGVEDRPTPLGDPMPLGSMPYLGPVAIVVVACLAFSATERRLYTFELERTAFLLEQMREGFDGVWSLASDVPVIAVAADQQEVTDWPESAQGLVEADAVFTQTRTLALGS